MRVHLHTDVRTFAYLDRLRPFIAEFVRNLLTPSRLQDGLPPFLPVVLGRDPSLLVLHGVLHQRLQLNSSSTGNWYHNHFDKDANHLNQVSVVSVYDIILIVFSLYFIGFLGLSFYRVSVGKKN